MATKQSIKSLALAKAKSISSKGKAKSTKKKLAVPEGQNPPQSKSYTIKKDESFSAKPVGMRWTKEGARKLGKKETSRPSAADIKMYSGKTFKIPRKPNGNSEDGSYRYMYSEKRIDKSDFNRKEKFAKGGMAKRVVEFTVSTIDDEQIFDTYQEAKDYFDELSDSEKEEAQFFEKEWVYKDGDYQEGDVIVHGGMNFAKGGKIKNQPEFSKGDLVFVKNEGSRGLVGLVISEPYKDEYGIVVCKVYYRGYGADILETDVDECVDIMDGHMSRAEENGDLMHYPSIAKKIGVKLNEKYLNYDENEFVKGGFVESKWSKYMKESRQDALIKQGYSKKMASGLSGKNWGLIGKEAQKSFKDYLISDEIESMKRMMESLFTYGGLGRDSYQFEEYLSKYIDILGTRLFDKTYNEYRKQLEDNYEVEQNVFTDREGLSYNSLKRKLAKGGKIKQRPPQSGSYKAARDKEERAKPVGYRFTSKLAKKLGVRPFKKPTAEQIEKYKGNGIYSENRKDKSDLNPMQRFATGGVSKRRSIKDEDVKAGATFLLVNKDIIEIKEIFTENMSESWVNYTRNGEIQENSVKQLRLFLNRLDAVPSSGKKFFYNGEIVWDSNNKRYGVVLNNYDNDQYGEIRLDSDGNQPAEDLYKLGSEGDKGTKEQLQEALLAHKRLMNLYPNKGYERVNYATGGMLNHGLMAGDKIIEIYKGYGIVEDEGVVMIVDPSEGTRFIVDLDDSKMSGSRKSLGMSYEEQIQVAKKIIDNYKNKITLAYMDGTDGSQKPRPNSKYEKGGTFDGKTGSQKIPIHHVKNNSSLFKDFEEGGDTPSRILPNPRTDTAFTPYLATGYAEGFETPPSRDAALEAWAFLIATGTAYSLQGWFGRTAESLISRGLIKRDGTIDWDKFDEMNEQADEDAAYERQQEEEREEHQRTATRYKFDELSDEAKETAIENMRESYYESNDFAEYAIDDDYLFEPPNEELTKLFGADFYEKLNSGKKYKDTPLIENTRKGIYFSLDRDRHLDASNAIDVNNDHYFMLWLGIPEEMHEKVYYKITDDGSRSADTIIEFEPNDNEYEFTDAEQEILDTAAEKFSSHMGDVLSNIEKKIDYMYTDESITETIEANDYDFDEDGDILYARGGKIKQRPAQSGSYKAARDKEERAKPVGHRFTNKLANKLGVSQFKKPTAEQVEKYNGKGIYSENRKDKSDIKPRERFEQGGDTEGENGYVAFYKGKRMEVYANSSYQAQKKAAEAFKAKKSYDVTVVLAEKGGAQVTHTPDFADGGEVKAWYQGEYYDKLGGHGSFQGSSSNFDAEYAFVLKEYNRMKRLKGFKDEIGFVGVNGSGDKFGIIYIDKPYFDSMSENHFKDKESFDKWMAVAKVVLETGKPQKGQY